MNRIIMGLSFGDEGKGLFTDYLASHHQSSLIVRFSGGHQAGHNVVIDALSHIFTNFGSGTLRGLPTYWSKYCTVEPIGIVNELILLLKKGITPKLYVDKECIVTTPYDVDNNRRLERTNKHGSCGVGFGSTINREENHYSLKFLDLFYPEIFETRLRAIEYYYHNIMDLTKFYNACQSIINSNCIEAVNEIPIYSDYIFEGSQGLLLDQNYGFFPNVSRTNTGMKNVIDIINKIKNFPYDTRYKLYLITRAYQTRHGNGFMTNENLPHNIKVDPLETNIKNDYQGKFRRSILDVTLLEYALDKDEYIKHSSNKNLVITCLDHVHNDYRFTYKGNLQYYNSEIDFVDAIAKILNIKNVYLSKNNNSNNIVYREVKNGTSK